MSLPPFAADLRLLLEAPPDQLYAHLASLGIQLGQKVLQGVPCIEYTVEWRGTCVSLQLALDDLAGIPLADLAQRLARASVDALRDACLLENYEATDIEYVVQVEGPGLRTRFAVKA